MTVNEKAAGTLVAVGAVVVLVCLPLLLGKVRRNAFYGFRFSKAFESEQSWLAINRFGAAVTMAWAVALMLVGYACLGAPPQDVLFLSKVGFASILAPVVLTLGYARGR